MTWKVWAVVGCSVSTWGCAAQSGSVEQPVLPLTTLRLYETGVGYFERSGTITSASDTLPVPASHVDDALKTLIVMTDGGKAQVAGVEFDSVMSRGLARSLAALPLDSDKPVSYADVLESLKGVDLELTPVSGSVVRGKLVEVTEAPAIPVDLAGQGSNPEPRGSDDPLAKAINLPDSENDHYLTLLSEDGSLRRFRASRVRTLKPLDLGLAKRLGAAAGALSGRAAQIQRGLRVLATQAMKVRLGYIAETPVWRSTYRLILQPGSKQARIQGWALIHNDTDERWKNVNVELVNGRPDSFLFPLSAPRYARRPLAEPAEKLSTVPQLAEHTPDQLWGDNIEESGESYGAGGLGLSGVGMGGGGRGEGYGSGYGSVTSKESQEISIGNLADIAQSSGLEVGALFSYRLANRLELRPHGSALVPFTSQDVEARRITWFESVADSGRSGVRLTNTSNQTLPSGPVAIYEQAGFSGETGVPRLKPKERAFLRFGIDLDVELEADPEFKSKPVEEPKKVRFEHGQLVEHYLRRSERSYLLTNRSAAARDVYVVLDIVKNASVSGADELDFDLAADAALAVFQAPARGKTSRKLVIQEALRRDTRLESLSAEGVRELLDKQGLIPAERRILEAAVVLLEVVKQAQTALADAEKEVQRVTGDLERMREHLKALGDKSGSPAGANPIVTRILDLEDKLSKQRRLVETLTEAVKDKQKAVKEQLETLGEDTPPAGPATKPVAVP